MNRQEMINDMALYFEKISDEEKIDKIENSKIFKNPQKVELIMILHQKYIMKIIVNLKKNLKQNKKNKKNDIFGICVRCFRGIKMNKAINPKMKKKKPTSKHCSKK